MFFNFLNVDVIFLYAEIVYESFGSNWKMLDLHFGTNFQLLESAFVISAKDLGTFWYKMKNHIEENLIKSVNKNVQFTSNMS